MSFCAHGRVYGFCLVPGCEHSRRIKDTSETERRIDPVEVAKALGADIIGRVSGPEEGMALYQERKRCPIMCRLLDESNAALKELWEQIPWDIVHPDTRKRVKEVLGLKG